MYDKSSYTCIKWDEKFDTGIPEIDRQHKRLVSILNHAELLASREVSKKSVLRITRDLLDYALYHFDYEEDLMRQHGYHEDAQEEAEAHKNQHQAFGERVASFREQLRVGDHVSPEALLDFIRGWLMGHILVTDKKFGDYVVGQDQGR